MGKSPIIFKEIFAHFKSLILCAFLFSKYLDFPASFVETDLTNAIRMRSNDLRKAIETTEVKPKSLHGCISKSSLNDMPIFMIYMEKQPQHHGKTTKADAKCEKSLWLCPMSSKLTTLWWIYTWPIKFLLTLTIPNPLTYRKAYPFTFFMCIVWIGVNSYVIVWMLSIIGEHFE